MNYFSPKTAAARYKEGRPPYHHLTVERISKYLNLKNRLQLAVDVACGTGLSTFPLTAFAEKVIGIDVSPEMLALTEPVLRVYGEADCADRVDILLEKARQTLLG